MMFTQVSRNATARLLEVRRLLAHIRTLEDALALTHDPEVAESVAILRGLLYVQLYGALEYTVEKGVQLLLQIVSSAGIPYPEFEHLLCAVTLDAEFESAATVKHDKKWVRRRDLLERQRSPTQCTINDTIFSEMLQSVKSTTIRDIFEWLCMPQQPVPDPRISGYIDEVTGRRHEVAHGRSTARDVGGNLTSTDLEIRINAITDEINHVVASFEDFVQTKAFIAVQHRPKYLSSP
jgi:hypothetical protein